MAKPIILLAENDPVVLDAGKGFLEQHGYVVLTAINPTEARNILESVRLDLAILDIRLKDDADRRDISGLAVAQEAGRFVPKIILTGHPHIDTVKTALKKDDTGRSLAIEYLYKREGPQALLTVVQKVLRQRSIFIVHGHDNEAKMTVARFIENLGLRPIILQEHPSAGRSIIEQLEAHSNVGYAIVLITPDDLGGVKTAPRQRKPRARQNVIFELGYFVGHLGRHKVSILYKEDVEIPSDYHGVVYIPLDSYGGWQRALVHELRSAGIDVAADSFP